MGVPMPIRPEGSLRGGAVWIFGLEMLLKYNFDSQCVTSVNKIE